MVGLNEEFSFHASAALVLRGAVKPAALAHDRVDLIQKDGRRSMIPQVERVRELVYTYSYGPHTLTYPEPFPDATRASVACATLTAGIAEHKSWDTDAISFPFMS